MTNMPEARLAREAELPYASVGMVTDYDCWKSRESEVDVPEILATLRTNIGKAHGLLDQITQAMAETNRTPSPDGIETDLDTAIMTPPDMRDPELMARLDAVAARIL